MKEQLRSLCSTKVLTQQDCRSRQSSSNLFAYSSPSNLPTAPKYPIEYRNFFLQKSFARVSGVSQTHSTTKIPLQYETIESSKASVEVLLVTAPCLFS